MGKKSSKEALADETDQLVNSILDGALEGGGIIGGFPCQDISTANNGATGLAGKRSGLFWEMVETLRLVGSISKRKPTILLENVAALFRSERQSDMGIVLGTLASSWRHTEWDCVGAGTAGAPQHRPRAYILAGDTGDRIQRRLPGQISRQPEFDIYEGIRTIEDFERARNSFAPFFCRRDDGSAKRLDAAKRLHGIGNGNPPCVIRELTRGLK